LASPSGRRRTDQRASTRGILSLTVCLFATVSRTYRLPSAPSSIMPAGSDSQRRKSEEPRERAGAPAEHVGRDVDDDAKSTRSVASTPSTGTTTSTRDWDGAWTTQVYAEAPRKGGPKAGVPDQGKRAATSDSADSPEALVGEGPQIEQNPGNLQSRG
jgi:hypothetical protein